VICIRHSCLELIDKQSIQSKPLQEQTPLNANTKQSSLTIRNSHFDDTIDCDDNQDDSIRHFDKKIETLSPKETEKIIDCRNIVNDWNLFGLGDNELLCTKTDEDESFKKGFHDDDQKTFPLGKDRSRQQNSHSIPLETEHSKSRVQKGERSPLPMVDTQQLLFEDDDDEFQQDHIHSSLSPPHHSKDTAPSECDFMFDISLLQYD